MANKLKIIDTHFHIWDLEKQDLPWLAGVPETIKKTFTIQQYIENYDKIEDIDFVGGIYVEIDGKDPIQEDEIIYNIKKNNEKLLATLLRSKVSPTMRVPAQSVGIREPLHTDDNPKGRCLEESFIEGLQELANRGLIFESCNRVDELDDLYQALKQVPELKVVLNHLGNPVELSEKYKKDMKNLASLPNLYVKVSGFATEDEKFVQELLEFIKETFDKDKLIYASNWPVVELYSTFDKHLQIVRDFFNDDEDIFYNNAIKCYNLKIK